jgi:hypothetical protein
MTAHGALPIDYPLASKPESASPQVDDESTRIVAPKYWCFS